MSQQQLIAHRTMDNRCVLYKNKEQMEKTGFAVSVEAMVKGYHSPLPQPSLQDSCATLLDKEISSQREVVDFL